jgi:hypothetical protein
MSNRHDEGTNVIETTLMTVAAAIVEKIKFDHMAVVTVAHTKRSSRGEGEGLDVVDR